MKQGKFFLLGITIILSTTLFYLYFKNPDRTLGIMILGEVDNKVLDSIQHYVSKKLKCKVIRLSPQALPASAFVHIKSPRYRADKLLDYLATIKPDTISWILGITNKDISFTKRDEWGKIKSPESTYKDFGIYGLAQRFGKSALVSTYRLKSKPSLFYQRVSRISIHEMGHVMGLPHCSSPDCVMQDANESIHTIDNGSHNFCKKCKFFLIQN